MSRSVKKGPFVNKDLLRKIQEMNEQGKSSVEDLVQSIDHFP